MKAKSIKGKSPKEIQAALQQSISDEFKPTLAIVFLSMSQDRDAICEILDTEGIAIFGATTESEFTEDGIVGDGIVILLMDIKPSSFSIYLTDVEPENAFESGIKIAEFGLKSFSNSAFIISGAHIETPSELIIKEIVEKAGIDVTIAGGMCGSVETFGGTVFTNNSSTTKGMLSLVLDEDKIELAGVAVSGWKPVGTEKTITKCVGQWVHTIDNQPAMDVVRKYIGSEIIEKNNTESIVRLNTSYPLQIKRDVGNPTMRSTLLFNTENKSVFIGGNIAEGETFRFSLPPDFDVIETVVDSSRKIKEKKLPDTDALIVFSCVGRLESLGPMASKEIEGLAGTWGKPMAGFFSLGEFGRVAGGKPEFHGTTCSWVALKEK